MTLLAMSVATFARVSRLVGIPLGIVVAVGVLALDVRYERGKAVRWPALVLASIGVVALLAVVVARFARLAA